MKTLLVLITLVLGLSTQAQTQEELFVSDECKATVEEALMKKFGANDETFSVVGMKALYGGTSAQQKTWFSPIILVRTSDEVEPRDMIVTTKLVGKYLGSSNGCKVTRIEVVADGSVLDVPEFE